MNNLTNIFSVLSNPIRLEIYQMILSEACECDYETSSNCVGAIAEKLKLNQPTVSNHIKELLRANLIITRKVGKHSYLFGVKESAKLLAEFSQFVEKEVDRSLNSGD